MHDFYKTRVAFTVSVAPILESGTLSPCLDSSLALLNRLYLYGYENIAPNRPLYLLIMVY